MNKKILGWILLSPAIIVFVASFLYLAYKEPTIWVALFVALSTGGGLMLLGERE